MGASSISIYQQHASKLLSDKRVVLGVIPLAASSIILFLQWRRRKSLKPRSRSCQSNQRAVEPTTIQPVKPMATATTTSADTATIIVTEKMLDNIATGPTQAQIDCHHARSKNAPEKPQYNPGVPRPHRPRLARRSQSENSRSKCKWDSYASLREPLNTEEDAQRTVAPVAPVYVPENPAINEEPTLDVSNFDKLCAIGLPYSAHWPKPHAKCDAQRPPVVAAEETTSTLPLVTEGDEETDNGRLGVPLSSKRHPSVIIKPNLDRSNSLPLLLSHNISNGKANEMVTLLSDPFPVVRTIAEETGFEASLAETTPTFQVPSASKPIVVAAATNIPTPQKAVIERIDTERAPLPGMGIPNA